MLKHDNPFWKNRKTEAEIIEQCLLYHITPPVERWQEEWTSFTDVCTNIAEERQRIREEKERAAQKQRHLVGLKKLKTKTLLNTIELHPSVSISVDDFYNIYPGAANPLRNGRYHVTLQFEDADETLVWFSIKYHEIDAVLSLLIDSCRQLNDLWPELQEALAIDRKKYDWLFLGGMESRGKNFNSAPGLFLSDSPYKSIEITPMPDFDSIPILDRMNSIIANLRQHLTATPDKP